jgi:hypothetical protein
MKRLLRFPIYVLILSGLLISIKAKADIWDNPRVKIYYSENKEFKLIITPKKTSDKYYLWDYYKITNPTNKKFKEMENYADHFRARHN